MLLAACAAEGEAAEPLTSGIERANFDPSVRFQDDLFHAVNGTWLAKTEIPADRADYGAFTVLTEQAEKDVRAIIENCASAGENTTDPEKKVGDLYASYMDEARAERLGIKPIAGMLAAIDRIESKAGLVRMLAELARIGISGVVDCSIAPDAKRSDRYIVHLSQAGLGLPGPRLLLGRQVQGKAGGLRGACRAEPVALRHRRCPSRRRRDRGLRDAACQGTVVEGGQPRQRQDLQQADPRGACPAGARLRLEVVPRRRRRRRRGGTHRCAPSYFTAVAGMADVGAVGNLEGVVEVESGPSARAAC